ncbi:MAG: helix-turn-helix transcriptional regulator [Verrucomicrobia bacterium]|nr:helix-turn-helix transcriptional regulator [Verrucomicrobiota bacterium]
MLPKIDPEGLITHRSDRSGFTGLLVLLRELPPCGYFKVNAGPDGYWFKYRSRPEKGELRLTIPRLGLARRRVTREDFVMVPPRVPLQFEWKGAPGRVAQFVFSRPCLETAAAKLAIPWPLFEQLPRVSFWIDHRLEALCSLLMEETQNGCWLDPLYFESLAGALAVSLLSRVRDQHGFGRRTSAVHPGIRRAIQRLENDFSDGASLPELADQARLSVDYFARSFQMATGCTPHQYRLRMRLSRARELMTQSDEGFSLTEIARRCGFFDQAHLCRHFRRFFGITPAAFRRAHANAAEGAEPSRRTMTGWFAG